MRQRGDSPQSTWDPISQYESRARDRLQRVAEHDRFDMRIGYVRLALVVAAVVVVWLALSKGNLAWWWGALPAVAFIAVAIWHEQVLKRKTLAERALLFYERGLKRIRDEWAGTGDTGVRFNDSEHVYSDDLDLFGYASIFELLCQAKTEGGSRRLADWLLHPATAEAIRERQAAVAESRGRLDLREALYVLSEHAKVRSEELVKWGESPALVTGGQWLAILLSLTVLICAGVWGFTGLLTPLAVALLAVAGYAYHLRPRVLSVLAHLDEAVHELDLLASVLLRLEQEHFDSDLLKRLRAALEAGDAPVSTHIRRLHGLAELADSRDNVVVRMIGPPLLYGTHLAFAVERWRTRYGRLLRGWLESLSEMEAVLSLAAYSFEHPADPFPEIVDGMVLDGEDLGHPLLKEDVCVRNSVRLGEDLRLLLVSGSNMSGKSTYLRTIGVNVVLAMAGGAVRATRLRLSPLAVGASIRVTDSLQGGSSRFYAEIRRLRRIMDLTTGEMTVLFLLDEMLNGTNSTDRRAGAEGILRELVSRNAFGLVTTHDLALTAIAEGMGTRARNIHFDDHLEGGELRFDYRVKDGVVQKSNALELMRSIGLRV